MSDTVNNLRSFSTDAFDAEVAAQRLLIAALQGGYVKSSGFSTDAAGAKELGEFLGLAAVTLAAKLNPAV